MRVWLLMALLLVSPGLILAAGMTTNAVVMSPAPVVNTKAGRVLKVLPLLLDHQGRDSTSPSLFDRDAYQLQLREHLTNEVSGVRFDVQWKAAKTTGQKLKIRVEARGVAVDGKPTWQTFETNGVAGFFSRWTKFTLAGDDYKKIGTVVSWRATLWDGDQLLGEQKSFLW
ncbi:MAG TPA: hypothetical protein VGO57_13200 [Verrucomicrobiae bacterium]